MTPPKIKQPSKSVRQLNDLYLMTRSKYLVQFPGGAYKTFSYKSAGRVPKLNDSMLRKHLAGDLTYGVFAGAYFTKFIAFDVDFTDADLARWATHKLIATLNEDFGVPFRDIHVSFSGGKGYHVELFFAKPVQLASVKAFYSSVMTQVGDLAGGQIEFRPNANQGVKLPLGVHQKTGKRCWFVANDTLEPLVGEASHAYLLAIQPADPALLDVESFALTQEQAADFETVATATDITVNEFSAEGALKKAVAIIEAGQLLRSGTRHETTFSLAAFYHTQGFEREEAVSAIMTILNATPRAYFSEGSKPAYWLAEAERLTSYVWARNITIHDSAKEVTVSKAEILAVLRVGTFAQKKLAYAMLVTSKRYGAVFYLTMNTAQKMIDSNSRPTVVKAIKKLVDTGYIEYVRKAEIDRALSEKAGRAHYKPNKYRIIAELPDVKEEVEVKVGGDSDLVSVVKSLLTEDEIKLYVKRHEFNTRFK
ncbi:hypothetical protein FLK61_35400 [Paenalkalicoccus suaedae]|uniref:TOTE conflict system primase domain-containing protein n=2 Tax=Paenalkalicoccus suaedae TaxID=2592382 RepID=A0A859FIA5_9BACI|nr:hypothetical protein FLK61_35400 [Paenalkalicoccus suaedae]